MQNIPTKTDGVSTLPAAEFNQIPDELENAITNTGQTLTSGTLTQISKAMSIYAAGGSFYTDSGAANAYVLSVVGSKQPPHAYFNGMEVKFLPGNANTGASTVNVATLGVKNIKLADGSTDPSAGDIPASTEITLTYDGTNFRITSKPPTAEADLDKVITVTSSSNASTIDLSLADPGNPVFTQVMTEATTFSFTNPKATGFNSGFKLFLTNAAGAYLPTWPGSVIWTGGIAPTLNVASKKYVLVFETIDGGTIWYGALSINEAS
jgi:hypothetical protein